MTHRFTIKEIARQSGLSPATIDRALHGRAHVSAQTKARVAAAMEELERQEALVSAKGRKLFVDVLVEAPMRFSDEVRIASEAAAANIAPYIIRPRFHGAQVMTDHEMAQALRQIGKRGSHGVCLKAKDVPEVRAAIQELSRKGIPVVTLVTDCPSTDRIGYVGLDNSAAGAVAARLLAMTVQNGTILATQSNRAFEGEDRRLSAFRAKLAEVGPALRILLVADASGLNVDTGAALDVALDGAEDPVAVYSMGGANRAIHASLRNRDIAPRFFVAHDLVPENRDMLKRGEIDVILDHDLERDMAQAFRHILAFHRLIAPGDPPKAAPPNIVFVENLPE